MVFCMMVAPFGVPRFYLMVRHYSTVEHPFNTVAHLFRVCYAMRSIRLRNTGAYSFAKSSTMRSRHWGSTRAPKTPVLL